MFSGNDLRRMKRLADQAIRLRARSGPHPVPDLLDLLRAGVGPEIRRRMSTPEPRDNLPTFIVAGHETTALALAWALYLLAFDTEDQHRAAIEAVAVLGGRAATAADLPRLTYIRQMVEEALRLYPSPLSCRAPRARRTSWAGARYGGATPSCCRSMRCIATTCSGTIPTASTPSVSPPA